MGRESWHAIKKLFNLPFLIINVRYPAYKLSYSVYFIIGGGYSNEFKCTQYN